MYMYVYKFFFTIENDICYIDNCGYFGGRGEIEMERGKFLFCSICNALPIVFESNSLPVQEKHSPGFLPYSYITTWHI